MTYYLHVTQAEYGCDYTIGCGSRLVALKATELGDDMRREIVQWLDDRGFDRERGETTLGEMSLFVEPDGADDLLCLCMADLLERRAAERADAEQDEIRRLEAQLAKAKAKVKP